MFLCVWINIQASAALKEITVNATQLIAVIHCIKNVSMMDGMDYNEP